MTTGQLHVKVLLLLPLHACASHITLAAASPQPQHIIDCGAKQGGGIDASVAFEMAVRGVSAETVSLQHENAVNKLKLLREKLGNNVVAPI